MTTKLSEIILEFIKPECDSIKIVKHGKHGGQSEDFDPLTLLNSFFESEMDYEYACELFDETLEELKRLSNYGPLSYVQISTTVIDCLSKSNHPNAPLWLSNYENIFGRDLEELKSEEGYIVVRKASELKYSILEIIGDIIGVQDVQEIEKQIGKKELTTITNRVIKIVRYCGFYKVKKEFLKAFCEELSKRSVKGIIPNTSINETKISESLNEAEKLLLLAKVNINIHNKSLNYINLVLEELGTTVLKKFGLLPLSASRKSFKQFVDILKLSIDISNGGSKNIALPHISNIRKELNKILDPLNIPLESYLNDCEVILNSLQKKFAHDAYFQTLSLLENLKIILIPNPLLNEIYAFEYFNNDIDKYLELSSRIFSSENLRTKLSLENSYIDVFIDFSYHELIEFGRRIRIRCLFLSPEQNLPADWLNLSSDDLDENVDIIPVLIINKDLSTNNVDDLRTIANEHHRCICPMDRAQFEKILNKPKEVRDVIQKQISSLIPESLNWRGKIFPKEKINLPENFTNYQKDTFIYAFAQIEHNKGSSACLQIGRLLEVIVRDYLLQIISFLNANNEKGFLLPSSSSKKGLKSYTDLFQSIVGLANSNRKIKKQILQYLPTNQLLNEIDLLREYRNDFVHEDFDVSDNEARSFLVKVYSIISHLNENTSFAKKAILFKRQNEKLYFFCEDGEIIDNDENKYTQSLKIWDCVYLSSKSFPKIVFALSTCKHCGKHTKVREVTSNGRFICLLCERSNKINNIWNSLLRKAEREAKKVEKEVRLNKMSNKTEVKNKWFKPLAEMICTIAGPFGAPLRGILTIKDQRKEEELDKKIDELLETNREIHNDVIGGYLSFDDKLKTSIEHISNCMAAFLTYQQQNNKIDYLKNNAFDVKIWPYFSLTKVLEKDIIAELCDIYPIDMDSFFSDLSIAGYPLKYIKRTGTPETDINNTVITMRKQSPELLYYVFQKFGERNPASQLINEIIDNLSAFLSFKS